jgi:hypothetical protein
MPQDAIGFEFTLTVPAFLMNFLDTPDAFPYIPPFGRLILTLSDQDFNHVSIRP